MAFGKATITGAVDTIKQGWTKFNSLIDDLLSTSSGKGASQVGIEDTAGNLTAANVETAIAEIYTDHATTRTLAEAFDEDSATTVGLTWGYTAGVIRHDNIITSISPGTVALTDDATNYVEIDNTGTVTKNTSSFTTGKIPIRQVTCASGSQTVSTDKRAWFFIGGWVPPSDNTFDLGSTTKEFKDAYVQGTFFHNTVEKTSLKASLSAVSSVTISDALTSAGIYKVSYKIVTSADVVLSITFNNDSGGNYDAVYHQFGLWAAASQDNQIEAAAQTTAIIEGTGATYHQGWFEFSTEGEDTSDVMYHFSGYVWKDASNMLSHLGGGHYNGSAAITRIDMAVASGTMTGLIILDRIG